MNIFRVSLLIAFIAIVAVVIPTTGCGRSTINSELIGQVKKVQNHNPILCPGYVSADVSLGIMNNGVGSMSTQDVWVTVPESQVKQFNEAVESAKPVKVHYDTWRVTICTENNWATGLEYVNLTK